MRSILPKLVLFGCLVAGVVACQSPLPDYEITSEAPGSHNKINVEVELKNPISKEQLESLSEEIHSKYDEYRIVGVSYQIAGEEQPMGAYAFSNFVEQEKPLMQIVGPDADAFGKIMAVKVKEPVLGDWVGFTAVSNRIIYCKKGNKLFFTEVYSNAGLIESEVAKDGNILRKKKSDDYYTIEPNGDLGIYNKEGKRFTVLRSINKLKS